MNLNLCPSGSLRTVSWNITGAGLVRALTSSAHARKCSLGVAAGCKRLSLQVCGPRAVTEGDACRFCEARWGRCPGWRRISSEKLSLPKESSFIPQLGKLAQGLSEGHFYMTVISLLDLCLGVEGQASLVFLCLWFLHSPAL